MSFSNIDTSQSYLFISTSEEVAHIFIFNRFKTLLFYQQQRLEDMEKLLVPRQVYYRTYISCADSHNPLVLVPSPIFLESDQDQYLSFITHEKTPLKITHSTTPQIQCVYSPSKTEVFLKDLFPRAEVFPEPCYLIKNIKYYQSLHSKAVLLHKQHGYIYVMAYDGDQVLFFNGFDTRGIEDISYYTLLAYNQCQYDTMEVPLLVSGYVSNQEADLELLKLYLGKIEFCPISLHLQELLSEEELRPHAVLLNTLLCAS